MGLSANNLGSLPSFFYKHPVANLSISATYKHAAFKIIHSKLIDLNWWVNSDLKRAYNGNSVFFSKTSTKKTVTKCIMLQKFRN